MFKINPGLLAAGAAAGAVTGLFGAGGGMVLVPLMTRFADLKEEEVFSASIAVILPVCLVSLTMGSSYGVPPWKEILPWLAGSALGGIGSGLWAQKIPVLWLHRCLGILILWGGWRYLWS